MSALVSTIPEPYYTTVQNIINDLHKRFGIYGSVPLKWPHFSYQGGIYNFEKLASAIREFSTCCSPIVIQTEGIGVFYGKNPVIYIKVKKSPALQALHKKIFEHFISYVTGGLNEYYRPEIWHPHITVASGYITNDDLESILGYLNKHNFFWNFTIDNLSFIQSQTQNPSEWALMFESTFGQGVRKIN